MKNYVKLTLFAVPLVAAAAYFGWQQWGARADTNLPAITQTIATGDIEDTVSAVGALQPLDYVDVGTNVSGQLKSITVQVGDKVKEGQLLAEIDPATYEAKVAADHAQIGNYQAQIGERTAARKKAVDAGFWPPRAGEGADHMAADEARPADDGHDLFGRPHHRLFLRDCGSHLAPGPALAK